MNFSFETLYNITNPSKETLDGFFIFLILKFYFKRSKTNEGNKPKAIFKPIETTATA